MQCPVCKCNYHGGACKSCLTCRKEPFYVSRTSDIPKIPHFAIITGSSHDDGYGGSSGHVEYEGYYTEEGVRSAYLKALEFSKWREPLIIKVTPVVPKIEIKLDLE